MRPGDSPGTYLLSVSPSVSYDFQAVFTAPVIGGPGEQHVTDRDRPGHRCVHATCVNGTEDPME